MIVCEEIFYHFEEIKIHEEKKYAIGSYNNGKIMKVTQTDHNMLIGKFDLKGLKMFPSLGQRYSSIMMLKDRNSSKDSLQGTFCLNVLKKRIKFKPLQNG